ncbi:hypothetical protein GCK72_007503 [Caenorhabditis remanei]|uniref:MRG domain-containing protein n=1 Tax=Caenorhabditis remanei TaxID=31234 RepID=A0A6A5HLQ1_CAERE|nr:hypothetical protein GCK72_007503 [Caenorhabditis remanei]KAF1767544.1 hypothetical protein GCK72_007503 [Caenorhabditis remanei]
MSAGEPIFAVNEKCVCLYQETVPYEAKIMGMKEVNGIQHYLVHYQGYAVTDTPVSPMTKSNKRKGPGRRQSRVKTTPVPIDFDEEGDEGLPAKRVCNLPEEFELSPPLIQLLNDDWLMVKQLQMTVKNHAGPSIDEIIKQYIRTISVNNEELREFEDGENHETTEIALIHSARSLVDYFNSDLGFRLLYPSERSQYNDLVQKEAMASGVSFKEVGYFGFRASAHYGVIHLVRLISRLPKVTANVQINGGRMSHIKIGISSIIEFLTNHMKTFFREKAHYRSQYEDDENEEAENSN